MTVVKKARANFRVMHSLLLASLLHKRREQINRHGQEGRRVVLAGNLAHGLQEAQVALFDTVGPGG